ncbi:MAG: aldehyde ferredoxin oxidoreductase family protein [Chloroflexota bacterium]
MKGVWNKLLRVDLTEGRVWDQDVPDEVYANYLGAAGLGAWVMYNEVPASVKSFDPENRIIFATGPFNGVRQTGAGKWSVISRSPSMELNADSGATEVWGIACKATGYDGVVAQGKAEKPVMVVVDDGKAELRDGSHLWGMDVEQVEEWVKDNLGKEFEVATIGRAGERGVRYAAVGTGRKSFAGRCGLGAVMGAKNLKAVAVRGTRECPVADFRRLAELNREINSRVAEVDKAKPYDLNIRIHGTAMATKLFEAKGNLPVKNWQLGEHPVVKDWHCENYTTLLNTKPWPCRYCTLQCHSMARVTEGKYAYTGAAPEYESFAMMGMNTLCGDVVAVSYAGHLANLYGMDTISLGAVLAWAMESYEKGALTREDSYGIDLSWGNADAVVELTRKIGEREPGLAWWLGEGIKRASEHYGKGSEAWAVQMKGQEVPAHDPRAAFVAGLTYLVGSSSGVNHERGNPQHIWVANVRLPEWGIGLEIKEEEKHSWDKASERTAIFQDWNNVVNSLGHCKFQFFSGYTLTDLLNSFNAITGLEWSQEQLRAAGTRIWMVQRMLAMRYGNTREADRTFPRRLMTPKPDGPVAGVAPIGIEKAVDDFYAHRGLDENGWPLPSTLQEWGVPAIQM